MIGEQSKLIDRWRLWLQHRARLRERRRRADALVRFLAELSPSVTHMNGSKENKSSLAQWVTWLRE